MPYRSVIALTAALLLAAPAAAQAAVSLSLGATSAVYGAHVTATGSVTPAVAGASIDIAVNGVTATTTTTAADGTFSAAFTASHGGSVTATDTGDASTSAAVALTVVPRVSLRIRSVQAFRRGVAAVSITPSSWSGPATLRIEQAGHLLATSTITLSGGRAQVAFIPDGYGHLTAKVVLGAASGFGAETVAKGFTSHGRKIGLGAKGRDVRILLQRLEARGFHTPGISTTLTRNAQDPIMAFHKAYRLPRTWDFQPTDWKLLLHGKRLRPRHTGPAQHIEIDKARQILMIVRNGRVRVIEHVSTGATGNTPVGKWAILWKAPQTHTWLGPAILYWTMTFHGGFAIHGFAPVPAYPASHGCTREPLWMANWIYQQSPVGETVYVY